MCTLCGFHIVRTDWAVDWKASTGSRDAQLTARLISRHQVYNLFIECMSSVHFVQFVHSHNSADLTLKCQQAPWIAEFGDMCDTLSVYFVCANTNLEVYYLYITQTQLTWYWPSASDCVVAASRKIAHIKCTICTPRELAWLYAWLYAHAKSRGVQRLSEILRKFIQYGEHMLPFRIFLRIKTWPPKPWK